MIWNSLKRTAVNYFVTDTRDLFWLAMHELGRQITGTALPTINASFIANKWLSNIYRGNSAIHNAQITVVLVLLLSIYGCQSSKWSVWINTYSTRCIERSGETIEGGHLIHHPCYNDQREQMSVGESNKSRFVSKVELHSYLGISIVRDYI